MARALVLTTALAISAGLGCGSKGPAAVAPGTDSYRWYDEPALATALDDTTSSTIIAGNAVTLLKNGIASFASRYANLEAARLVLVKTFIWTDDEAGRKLADAIAAKARQGVPVIIQYDVKGNVGSLADAEDMLSRATADRPVGEPKVIADLRTAGAIIIETNSPGRPLALKEWVENTKRLFVDPAAALRRSRESLVLFDHVDHDKYFITADGNGDLHAIIGGLNLASEYAFGGIPNRADAVTGRFGWRDTDMEIVGPAAHAVLDEFLIDAERHLGKPLETGALATIRQLAGDRARAAGHVALRFVVNNPLAARTRRMDDLYALLVRATPLTEPIYLSTPYFAPSKRLREAMHAHMEGGGEITVLTNSYESSDVDVLTDAARYTARDLAQTGRFRLFEWIPSEARGETMLHQKVATFGVHGPVIIGSANLDAQSFVHNGEAVVVISDSLVRKQFDEMNAADLAVSRAIGADVLNNPSFVERVRAFSAGKLAWYWL